MRRPFVFPALCLALLVSAPAQALTTGSFTFSFSFPLAFEPEAVAFGTDTQDGNAERIFVSDGDNTIHVFDVAGTEHRTFSTINALDEIRGLDYRDATNTLLISTNEALSGFVAPRVREIDLTGAEVGGGIDLTLPGTFEPEAAFYHDGRGTFFVADEEGASERGTVTEFALDGTAGDGTNGAFFEVFNDPDYDDPNGMDWIGDFLFIGDDNSSEAPGPAFVSRLQVYDLNGTQLFTEEWSTLTNTLNTSVATSFDDGNPDNYGYCQQVTTSKGLNCADFEGLTIDDITVSGSTDTHMVAIFEDQQTLIAWKLDTGDLPSPPGSVPPPPGVPEPGLAWLLGAALVGILAARRRD